MKLYGICLVKDEDDIIEQTLKFATDYCDKIFVLDNGSTDKTWELVKTLAVENPKIIPFGQVLLPFDDGMRALVYNEKHGELSDEDWWLRLDGDEFLAQDPKPLLELASREGAELIRTWQIQFYFTERDLEQWQKGEDSRDRPIFDRRRFYLINWQEPRFFRNRNNRKWDTTLSGDFPNGLERVWRTRILNRHYQFRDPEQIEKRLRLRYGHPAFRAHVRSIDWRSSVRESRGLECCREGEPWRFSASGVAYYYRKTLYYSVRGKCQSALRLLYGWIRLTRAE